MNTKGTCTNTGRTHFKKGMTPWNKGLKGYLAGKRHYNYGKHWSKEVKAKMSRNRKGKAAGENCYLWKGGIYPQVLKDRVKFRQTIQKEVFERDNYTCCICGQVGGFLTVDHIQSWSEYPELRFNMDNCRTLCQRCHYKITYGREMPQELKRWGYNFKHIGKAVD